MKRIKCPACGRAHRNQKYCVSCGCYLPPILEEEQEESYNFIYTNNIYNNLCNMTKAYAQSELTNVADTVNYEMEKLKSQINADYIKLSSSIQTQYIINSLNNYHYSSERDINGRIKK